MNKIFLWKNCNGADSDFFDCEIHKPIVMPNSSNAHSGGLVVIAENKQEALELAKKYSEANKYFVEDEEGLKDIIEATPIMLDLSKKGVVLYCDGDC